MSARAVVHQAMITPRSVLAPKIGAVLLVHLGIKESFNRGIRLVESLLDALAEGLDLLENIAKNYPRTPLADEAIKLLIQYGRK